jgi:hypothetical protein
MSDDEPGYLSANRYGKDLVRVARVVRVPAEGNKPARQEGTLSTRHAASLTEH